ncbi:aminotransferase class I/II-fold pyridoxal phosphate-dependent enzyme [Liquorilactobacillus satsumensis]|uniref:pyridoxal phosphate-dependent aminotransferase n=1 Tax=Liquorilactobacillus satsumensis TaxID=259059 RepID=UPI0021C33081|nr:aminotransferase class I/II-fold pyridoxal phosphate-dependent enzyme [Liquorilactobacillus satsumensis]MCP9312003.1 aminotransferase class I/II-fold pyridoxal phosphate-dependent enzyme [Liquorilactobacillus satsumensis]MCP9359137.1 aminotransferase class I/II-fold pyridoxal phosphate-dependent enzyme [Liquorilactobacillus satsumensis]
MSEIKLTPLLKRSLQQLTPSLIRTLSEKYSKIPGIINLTIGEPDFATPTDVKLAAIKSILADHTHYAPNKGTPQLLQAISDYLLKHFELQYDPQTQIITTNGASEAISTVINGLIEPGDIVLLVEPAFSLYRTLTLANNGIPITLNAAHDHFKLTPSVLKQSLEHYGKRTKLVVLNYPNNPTGVTYTAAELEALAAVLREYQVAVLSDEVYSELTYFQQHVSLARYLPEQVLLVNSVSKAYAMTGWRIGYLCGSAAIIKELAKVHQANVATVGTPNMDAATAALQHGDLAINEMKKVYLQKRKYLCKELQKIGLEFVPPQGTFYVYVRIPTTFEKDAAVYADKLAHEALIAVIPGSAFEAAGSRYFRISYAVSMEKLQLAVQRLTVFVHNTAADKSHIQEVRK